MYLVHWFIVGESMDFWDRLLGPEANSSPWFGAARLLTVLAGTLAVATVFNLLVERPAIRLGKRLADRLVPLAAPQLATAKQE